MLIEINDYNAERLAELCLLRDDKDLERIANEQLTAALMETLPRAQRLQQARRNAAEGRLPLTRDSE